MDEIALNFHGSNFIMNKSCTCLVSCSSNFIKWIGLYFHFGNLRCKEIRDRSASFSEKTLANAAALPKRKGGNSMYKNIYFLNCP